MASRLSKLKSRYQIRSISLPCRSHPSTVRIEEELNKLREEEESISPPNAKTIKNGLSRLEDLFKCTEDLLNLPLIQQALSLRQHERYVNDLQDGFINLLDLCGTARDVVAQIKEHGRDIQSSLRRRKGDSSIESSIAKYSCLRKNMKKDAKKLIAVSKQMENKIAASPLIELDHHVASVVRALREVCVASLSILNSLLLFLSIPTTMPKSTRTRSLVSKLVNRGAVVLANENQPENVNELQSLDSALQALYLYRMNSREGDKVKIAQDSLKLLDISIEAIENGLECFFKGLIKARATLLNIVSA